MVRVFEVVLLSVGLYLCVTAESDEHILQEFAKMKAEMAELRKTNEVMAEEILNLKDMVGQKTNIGIPRNKRVVADYGVSFTAELGSHLHKINRGSPIVYDRVPLNYGHGYNSSNGIFVVPLSGVYVFYWNLMTDGSSALDTTLMSSRGRLADGYAHPDSTGGNLVLAQLNRGDHVYVQKADTYGNFLHSRFTSFSGFLLHEIEQEPLFG